MSWLAKRDNPQGENLVGVVMPETNVVSVWKERQYSQNHSVPGFQFERLVTGNSFVDLHDIDSIEHLHVMKVGTYTILFCAEVDAITSNGTPVEITFSRWIQNKIFQMISNGSSTLCAGTRGYGHGSLTNIQMMPLGSIISPQQALAPQWRTNILEGLEVLKSSLQTFGAGEPFEVTFAPNNGISKLQAKEDADSPALPPVNVIKDLFGQ